MGNKRIISDTYLSGGMGDGGGCHPRDNIALSWLSRQLDLSFDWFHNIMMQREKQSDWLATLVENELEDGHKIYILGKAFKPETNLTTGSPSILLSNILKERGHSVIIYDPWLCDNNTVFEKGCYFIGTKHPQFTEFKFPGDSVVIDPWRFIPDQHNVKVIRLGE